MKKNISLLILFLVLIFMLSFFIVYNIYFKIKIDNSNIIIIDNLDIDVYSEVFVSDLIKIKEGKILKDFLINTKQLGKKEILFLYEDSNKKKYYGNIYINIIDKESPIIFLNNSYSVLVNSNINLEDSIMSVDNYDDNPKREIIGKYSLDIIGKYNLEYRVTDNSGNVTSKKFILNVTDANNSQDNNKKDDYLAFSDIYSKYKNKNNMIGIDVSKWQGEIDYSKIGLSEVEFVMIKIGGQNQPGSESIIDPYFVSNISEFSKLGIKIGIYYYSHASSIEEASNQAKWVIEEIDKYNIDLPIVFDWENWNNFNSYKVSLYKLNEIANTFINVIEKNGYEAMIYGSKYYLENIWNVNYKNVWLAHYTTKTDYMGNYLMWQLSNIGKIEGIEGYVDIDIMNIK